MRRGTPPQPPPCRPGVAAPSPWSSVTPHRPSRRHLCGGPWLSVASTTALTTSASVYLLAPYAWKGVLSGVYNAGRMPCGCTTGKPPQVLGGQNLTRQEVGPSVPWATCESKPNAKPFGGEAVGQLGGGGLNLVGLRLLDVVPGPLGLAPSRLLPPPCLRARGKKPLSQPTLSLSLSLSVDCRVERMRARLRCAARRWS